MSSASVLQACLRDLVSLISLPSLCHGRPPGKVLTLTLETLLAMLPIELAYARLSPTMESLEAVRLVPGPEAPPSIEAVREALEPCLRAKSSEPVVLQAPFGEGELRALFIPLGFYADAGVLVLASRETGFPSPLHGVILRAAASLAAAALENARLLEAAKEADRRKDQFLALLGHELRNPLAPIVTALQLMKLRNVGAEKERAIIERQAHHMVQLVDDLLDLSRVTRGQLVLNLEGMELASVVGRAVEMANPLIEQRRHALSVSVPEGMAVMADSLRLAQVFANLLTNAAKYTDPGGRIELAARRAGGRLFVSVRDTGRGIAPAMLERIFDPFFQADRSKEALAGGLGLGLALVKNLVTLHLGTVAVRSLGAGQGSEFTVELPALSASDLRQAPGSKPAQEPRAVVPRRVLVVDDNEDAARLLADALKALGHVVSIAYDGPTALSLAASFRPEAAVVDIGLPVMDGYSVARQLRGQHGEALVLVAVTGFGDDGSRQASFRAGFKHCLIKPIDVGVLMRVLHDPEAPL